MIGNGDETKYNLANPLACREYIYVSCVGGGFFPKSGSGSGGTHRHKIYEDLIHLHWSRSWSIVLIVI